MQDMEMGMEMGTGLPAWLTTLSWMWIVAAVVSSGFIVRDIRNGHRQSAKAMEYVWPLAALYLGPLAWPVYQRFGRSTDQSPAADAVRSGLPGGVSSGLAHIVAVPFVVATGLTLFGLDMWAMVAIITVLATGGIFLFEYVFFTKRDLRVPGFAGVRPALMIAVIAVVAFDVGMLGWMLILHHTENMPAAGDIRFTFLMQIGLVLGTLTALPAMRLLIARGIKPVA
ncbi:DUF4396 domain-containing protein [Conexibacter sp. W3-3-2]|nr:DUF4396 domain-containing protein [Conexibacter sp. W3-3-2]